MCSSVYGNEVANRSRAGIKLSIKRSRGNRHYFHFIKKTNVRAVMATLQCALEQEKSIRDQKSKLPS